MPQAPDNPDIESMPQQDLVAWLDNLSEQQNQITPPPNDNPPSPNQQINEDDDETPTAITAIDEASADDTTDPLTWLDSPASQTPADAPTHSADKDNQEDPLDWLEPLANEVAQAAETYKNQAPRESSADNPADDDDALSTAEDESLYSQRVDESPDFLESLAELDDDSLDFTTQSMAPLPDFLPSPDSPSAHDSDLSQPTPAPLDSLTQAFLMQNQQAALEAWYQARLHSIATDAPATNPAPQSPPPGLAAGFNSARGKIAQGNLDQALSDYETLLQANIGLHLVVSDMTWLLEQAQFRDSPAVLRVLGDALMQQGQLQKALAVYRRAINLLENPQAK